MNGTSFLLLLVFMVAGYVIHPLLLPSLQAKGLVAETEVEDVPKKKKVEDMAPQEDKDTDTAPETGVDTPPAKQVEVQDVVIKEKVMPNPVTSEPAATTPVDSPPKKKVVVMGDGQFYKMMRDSVASGDVKEFNVDQVVDWKRLGRQSVDGVEYDVGVATYKAKTIFGEQDLEAKALTQDGNVVKWLWGATDTEMK